MSHQLPPGRYEFVPRQQASRLDVFVADAAGISRRLARRLIELGGVHIDHSRVRVCSRTVPVNCRVELFVDKGSLTPFSLSSRQVLFHDEHIIALNKPAGVPTQPTPARHQGTLYTALQAYLHNPWRPLDRPSIGMHQRLDQDTSGVVVFSIHPRAHKPLSQSMQAGQWHKTYWGFTSQAPSPLCGQWHHQLRRNRQGAMEVVARGGKQAVTDFATLATTGHLWLLNFCLHTGRMHQIRVQSATAGCPLLGDHRYGGCCCLGDRQIPRQMLHSRLLCLPHPLTGQELQLEAPLPDDMASLLHPSVPAAF